MNRYTDDEIKAMTAYARKHFTIKKCSFGRGEEGYQALMDDCFITIALTREEHEHYRNLGEYILVGDYYLMVGGEVRLLTRENAERVESYRDFNPKTESNVACIAKLAGRDAWMGWSNRSYNIFEIGDVVEEGDLATWTGYAPGYAEAHPDECFNVPAGFECRTLEDCRRAAIAYAMAVN